MASERGDEGWIKGEGIRGELDEIPVPCPFTLTIAGHTMQCQLEKGHHLQTEHSFSIDWPHESSDGKKGT